ncbi:CheR family methyltransferase [Dyella acidisoli]|uniref:protein-glutamate O-methyltransferase n=1 Tax=Dyella acidisoli TaxID=1867834 RepID=A0ABQ5XHB0_9GAMM|nr:CheR family methyltransferase [Dyella acidisoli]GLQ91075.1 putative biofilm formation methyltransferase WspC [Dyella acidisoli]
MSLPALEQMLKDRMGLDAASIGRSSVERAVKERMAACAIRSFEAYSQRVHHSHSEMQELIEAIVVPETWFFRDREAFSALAKRVENNELRLSPPGSLRILSVPCSSGEEPYTIAMTLQECGLPSTCYRIDAVDISSRALAQAAMAVYGSNAFRGTELDFRETYFSRTTAGWRLNDTVRASVHFQQNNILAPGFMPGEALYDIVFCRNLLIYFDRPTQERVVMTLRRLLKPQGILFVGSSETGLLITLGFVLEKIPQAYALRLPGEPASVSPRAPERHKPVPPGASKKVMPVSRAQPAAVPPRPSEKKPIPPSLPPSPKHDRIAEAMRLADQGRLHEATDICESYVQEHGVSAQSCHLMGLLSKTAGREHEAIAYFRKALYLDSQHSEAMSHLALLLEKQGDDAGAKVLRNRLRRLSGTSASGQGDACR